MKSYVLLVEDEVNLRNSISLNLELEGYVVTVASNGLEALEIAKKSEFDLIVMDYMMPKMDGLTACKKIREFDQKTPILFLSAKSQPLDRIEGLKAGANDYLGKPFHLEELLLRVKNLLPRETNKNEPSNFSINGRYIDLAEMIVDYNGETFTLSKKETEILRFLISRNGQVVSRNDILDHVWGDEEFPSPRTVDNFIMNLRKRLENDPGNPEQIRSVRGVGYKVDLVN